MKIGLFFGSFNPIHIGHLIIAQRALAATELDRVWFVVSPQNPFKKKDSLLAEHHRLYMVNLAVEDNFHMLGSNIEFNLPRPSYTIDTLTVLADKYPSYEFSLIMGGDNLQHLHKWKNIEAIMKYYQIYVYPRSSKTEPGQYDDHPSVNYFEAPLLEISATYLRDTLKAGNTVRYMVHEKVLKHIEDQGFYAS